MGKNIEKLIFLYLFKPKSYFREFFNLVYYKLWLTLTYFNIIKVVR